MKIGIITLYGNFNYGNRLQNYALQEVLLNMGCEVSTLVGCPKINFIKKILKKYLERRDGKIKIKDVNEIKREKIFFKFTQKNIKTEFFYNSKKLLPARLNDDFDYFIVGSDQVWNPKFWNKEGSDKNNFLMSFALPEKRISYAASFGISKLPKEWKDIFKKELIQYKKISVREITGKEIIKELYEKEVLVVLDPTMLLSKKEWEKIEEKPSFKINKKYIFSFFLGKKSSELESYLKDISNDRNLEIIELMDKNNTKTYISNPGNFLYLLNQAELIITDSFHATVFSIIFHKPFIALKREQKGMADMSDRITTLLKKFKLEERGKLLDKNLIFNCSFNVVDEILEEERKISLGYLKESLNLNRFME